MQVYQKISTQMFRGTPLLRRALIVCSLGQRSLLTYSCLRFFNLAKSSFCRFWILFEDKSLSNKKENTWYVGLIKTNVFITLNSMGAAQWWEHSPPTNVARVRILASTPYVGWVCCSFSPLLREVFLRVLRFSPLLKNQHFQIPIRSGTHGHVSTSSYELLSAPWVNKLQFTSIMLSEYRYSRVICKQQMQVCQRSEKIPEINVPRPLF